MIATALLIAWCWTADSGALACTDDVKRVPEKYRPSAERVEVGTLADYPRLTIVER